MAVGAFFHPSQLEFKPRYEWAFGKRIKHPETTRRAESIVRSLRRRGADYELREPSASPLALIRRVHADALSTLYETAEAIPAGEDHYPHVFPREMIERGDPTNLLHAGAFCFDAGTPLNRYTNQAATWSAACAVEAARAVQGGEALTYAVSRPPGHHAERAVFGGYCYFNNAALAAHVLRKKGRVVVLDIDFHHGNGTQSLFYRDPKVLVVNVHGDPREFFPFYCGFAHERGVGRGEGFNLNVPLPRGTRGKAYLQALRREVVPAIQAFDPHALVLSAGLDGYEKDPIGGFGLTTEDFRAIGTLLGRLHLPTVAVQEGGYHAGDLGSNAVALLDGLRDGRQRRRLR